MSNTVKKERVWEIDFLRGSLILLMIFMHLMYDLQYYYNVNVNYQGGILGLIRIIFAPFFIIVSGISTSFSRSSLRRGSIVLVAAMSITLISYLIDPAAIITFGILHFMGVCMVISPLLKKMSTLWLFVVSSALFSTSFIIPNIEVTHNYLFMFGLYNSDFSSADYYPLLPYGWAFLFGMGLSRILYKDKRSIFPFTIKNKLVNFVGRNSLYIYMVHQPVILAALYFIMGVLK